MGASATSLCLDHNDLHADLVEVVRHCPPEEDIANAPSPGPYVVRPYQVKCPKGHVMRAKLSREMLQLLRCNQLLVCDQCDKELSHEDAYYHCKRCSFDYCMACSRTQLGLPNMLASSKSRPMLELQPGDILLAGPDRYDIHHVILVRGCLQPASPDMVDLLRPPPGTELFLCPTIESTQSLRGKASWWYPTTSILERDSHAGTAAILGDLPPESTTIMVTPEPVPLKVLLHPLRRERSGERLDGGIFEDVLEGCKAKSQRYSWATATAAFLAYQRSIKKMEYGDMEAREGLLSEIVRSWDAPPICAAVPVKVWQQYLVASRSSDDAAALAILRWMPMWCHRTTPSALVKTLTHKEWGLYGSLEA